MTNTASESVEVLRFELLTPPLRLTAPR
jgi:hypothetical protein